jgi:DNA-binding MarR family transcriptional regulator
MILGHQLALAINRFDHIYRDMQPPLGLTQLIILQAIEDGKDMYESRIAEKVGLERESVRLVLHRIYKRKLFSKKGKRKVSRLYITPAGKEAIARSEVLAARTQGLMLAELSPRLGSDFLTALTMLTSSLCQTQSPSS